jgi:preprotein translocase subunit SecA
VRRTDRDDIIFRTMREKFDAVSAEILDCHKRGQPVLVGTTSVEKSEMLARELSAKGVPHEVLNAKNHHREALIVAQAGRKGAVTISTNMAGRGTDIRLGGNAEALARLENPGAPVEELASLVTRYEAQCRSEAEEVRAAGGLHIVGTERHESRRVDNQLRGRSGRQGDPGSSRFYLSMEDDLLRIFGSDKITNFMERMGIKDDEPVENRWVTRSIENAQVKVEAQNFNMRKNLLEYDDVMNYQRKGVYELRRRALAGEGIRALVDESVDAVVKDIMDDFVGEGIQPESWNIPSMRENLERVFAITWEEADGQIRDNSRDELRQRMLREARARLDEAVVRMGDAMFVEVARYGILQLTDSLWKDHLLALDRLRQGVSLRGYGQRNPLLEYKREALQMYMTMNAYRDEQLVAQLLRVEPGEAAPRPAPKAAPPRRTEPAVPVAAPAVSVPEAAAPSAAAPERGQAAREWATAHGVRRNDPCPCGSGTKYKKCCGADAAEAEAPA